MIKIEKCLCEIKVVETNIKEIEYKRNEAVKEMGKQKDIISSLDSTLVLERDKANSLFETVKKMIKED
jgi:flagellin-specific chaperone FliS